MKNAVAGLLLLLITSIVGAMPASAQDAASTVRIDRALPAPPRISVPAAEQPIVLKALDVRVEIAAGFARTRVEMLFANPNARVLEGELQFPLLAGQVIDGFALDIDGQLRDAVPIEKAKGKQVFEDTIRRKVDPALLESTGGENFRLRVYPLPANGTRRVVVYVSEPLEARAGSHHYRLALAHAKSIAQFALEINVMGAGAAPSTTMPAPLDGALRFVETATQYRGTIRRSDFSARGWIDVAIPEARAGSSNPPSAIAQRLDGATYLQADVPVTIKHLARTLPTHVAIVWDSSGSGATRDHAAEFGLLDAYVKAMGSGRIDLVRVRDVAESALTFHIHGGEWSELKRALQDTVYDGASDLAAWRVPAEAGEVLFFTDGLANFGASLSASETLATTQRIFPVVAAASANRAWLRQLARSGTAGSSGALIDLAGDVPTATARLLQASTEIVAIEASGDVDVNADDEAWHAGRLRLHGVTRGDLPSSLRVRLRDPDGALRTIMIPVAIDTVAGADSATAPLAARLWARARLDALEGDARRHRAEIRRIGLQFAMVTRETSLIVLDDVADYVRHDIDPPRELRTQFDALKATAAGSGARARAANIDRVAREYADKIAWWQREFPKGDAPKAESKGRVAEDRAGGGAMADARVMRQSASVAAPAPTAEAAPSAARAAPAGAPKKAADSDAAGPAEIGITLKKWTADARYIARLRDATDADLYAVYLDERADWKDSSAFVLDAADLLFERKRGELALRVLSNLAEMDLENRQILRILGYRLLQAGKPKLAVPLFEQVRDLAPFEPQSFRDLGLAYAAAGATQQAADALYEVAVRTWDSRFAEVALIALSELNALVATHRGAVDVARFDERLLRNLPVDLRVVLNWDADNSDMDLWVTDPNGERAFYGNRLTFQGGRMSADLTGGYGPEEFMLRVAKPGKYKVEANYYGNRQQLIASSVSLRLALITGFGRADAREQSVILRLGGRSESVLVGEFEVGGSAAGSQ